MPIVQVAIAQHPPAVLDAEEGVRRAVSHVEEAAADGARLIAFPETWLSGYPAWVFAMAGWDDAEARRWHRRLVAESLSADDARLEPLRRSAARTGAVVVIGFNERHQPGSGTLYNSLLTIDGSGDTVGVHRKLVPTHTERTVWAPAPDGSSLRVADTAVGRLGGLVCWEHWHPLIRQSLHAQGEEIHVAVWPDLPEAHEVAARSYAFEGRCFVLSAAQFLRTEDVPEALREAFRAGVGPDASEDGMWFPGGSAVAGPDGRWRTEPLRGRAGTVHAEIDLGEVIAYKQDLDVAGHYARPDVFTYEVDRRTRPHVRWRDDEIHDVPRPQGTGMPR